MPAASGLVWVEVDGVRIDGAGVDGAGMCLMESGWMEYSTLRSTTSNPTGVRKNVGSNPMGRVLQLHVGWARIATLNHAGVN